MGRIKLEERGAIMAIKMNETSDFIFIIIFFCCCCIANIILIATMLLSSSFVQSHARPFWGVLSILYHRVLIGIDDNERKANKHKSHPTKKKKKILSQKRINRVN